MEKEEKKKKFSDGVWTFLISAAASYVADALFGTTKGVLEYFYIDPENGFYQDFPYLYEKSPNVFQRVGIFNDNRIFGKTHEQIAEEWGVEL